MKRWWGAGAALIAMLWPGAAGAIEAFDGRLQLHGYAETQVRTIARNFDPGDGYHLAQWWNILNLELEADIAPEGWGPFDYVSGFVRVEARYDCVWTGGCHLFPGYENRYGDDAERLPRHLSNGKESGRAGVMDLGDFGDKRNYILQPLEGGLKQNFYGAAAGLGLSGQNVRSTGRLWNTPLVGAFFFAGPGLDKIWATDDDPGFYIGSDFLDYRFGVKRTRGPNGGRSAAALGPWRPQDKVPDPGALRHKANPLKVGEFNPVLVNDVGDPLEGFGALPFRQAPEKAFDDPDVPLWEAQGDHIPNPGFRRLAEHSSRFEFHPDANFSQTELSLNRGASQERFKELKELYVDLEMFDHRLWLRLGRQTIVWGKTELFRAQDQFNPQDIGIASLPSLEESRIPVWSARGIWSFYDVGPLQDVRLEVAMNVDEFEPLDVGRCGEPFAVRIQCSRSFGLFAYSVLGAGLMGEFRPPAAWDSYKGLEGGVRFEFRQDRVSYAFTYFNGYNDIPYAKPIFRMDRNVDPFTGRPRPAGVDLPCDPDGLGGMVDVSGCFGTVLPSAGDPGFDPGDPTFGQTVVDIEDSLLNHHANQQLFTSICAATVTFVSLLPDACAFNIWNSAETIPVDPSSPLAPFSPTFAMGFSVMLSGSVEFLLLNSRVALGTLGRYGDVAGANLFTDGLDIPLVPLNLDPNFDQRDELPDDFDWYCERITLRGRADLCTDPVTPFWRAGGVSRFLTNEQEALIGCGRFWGTDCEADGFDIFNAEASALFQSWPGYPGTEGVAPFDTFDSSFAQPGTVGFFHSPSGVPTAGARCTRYVGGALVTLPGCLGPSDGLLWVSNVDGDPRVPNTNPVNNPMVLPVLAPGDPRLNPADPAYTPTPAFFSGHPFTGQPWQNELAIVSWNLLVTLVATSVPGGEEDDGDLDNDGIVDDPVIANDGVSDEFQPPPDPDATPEENEARRGRGGRFDEFNPVEAFAADKCSYRNPVVCKTVGPLLAVAGQNKRSLKAAGNGRFGRSTFLWHDGVQVAIDYDRSHVVGMALDFAEDRTRSSWGMEFVWFTDQRFLDNGSAGTNTKSDTFNFTVSVDRPTFIRFLNKNRTFFFNSQVFLRYIPKWSESFVSNGPVTALMTFSAFTGYMQDRLLPGFTAVYDWHSRSGALLYSLSYRVSERFTFQIGANSFFGRFQKREAALVPIGAAGNGGGGQGAHKSWTEQGLSLVRDRDELFFRARYSF